MKKGFVGDRGEHNNNLNFVLHYIFIKQATDEALTLEYYNTWVYLLFAVISFTTIVAILNSITYLYSFFNVCQ